MSTETMEWLNTQTLIGHTDQRGQAWHYRESNQGGESNHYAGAIPLEDVTRRLFSWKAEESPMFVKLPATLEEATILNDDGTGARMVLIDGRKAITRSDTGAVLGIFKGGYQPHQPEEWLLEALAVILGESLDIGSAALLKGGAVAFVQAEMRENMFACGDQFRPFILGATSFDGSLSTTYKVGITRTVCDNTLEAALFEDGATVKVKHTRYSHLNASAIRDAFGLIEAAAATYTASVERLTNTQVSEAVWSLFLDQVCPIDLDAKTTRSATLASKKREELSNLWTNDLRVAPWSGTAFGVLQATNTWAHHVQTVRGTSRVERNALNAITGESAKDDRNTLETLERVLQSA